MYATEICEDEILKLAMNFSFSVSLRIGELCGLTRDCVDISQEAVEGVDTEILAKVLANPEMVALLSSLAKTISNYKLP